VRKRRKQRGVRADKEYEEEKSTIRRSSNNKRSRGPIGFKLEERGRVNHLGGGTVTKREWYNKGGVSQRQLSIVSRPAIVKSGAKKRDGRAARSAWVSRGYLASYGQRLPLPP